MSFSMGQVNTLEQVILDQGNKHVFRPSTIKNSNGLNMFVPLLLVRLVKPLSLVYGLDISPTGVS